MRKLAIVFTSLLLLATLVLMAGTLGLIPFPTTTTDLKIRLPQIGTPFISTEKDESTKIMPATPKLVIQNSVGNIVIRGEATDEIQITLNKTAKSPNPILTTKLLEAISLITESNDSTTTLKLATPRTAANEQASGDLTILIPTTTSLDISTDLGNIDVTKTQGPLKAYTALGTISIQEFIGTAALESSLGNISIKESIFPKDLLAKTSLGDLYIQGTLGKSSVIESSLGNLELALSENESYVLEGRIKLGDFTTNAHFKGQQRDGKVQGVIGEGEPMGMLFVNLDLGNLKLHVNRKGEKP